jgi:PLP dependent protein
MSETLAERLEYVRKQIETAALKAGRDPSEVKLVAVSKTHPAETVREALAAGGSVFGENKVQEGLEKIAEIGRGRAEWHLIGHLQKNKARKVVRNFDVIQTLDSVELAERLERICGEEDRAELKVLVQVDLADEETKSGIEEKDLPELAEYLKSCERLKFAGLMIIPPFFEDPEKVRPFFRRLREIRDNLRKQNAFTDGGELSMGMSHDFEVAVAEGATLVRVGTAIFGRRSYNSDDG